MLAGDWMGTFWDIKKSTKNKNIILINISNGRQRQRNWNENIRAFPMIKKDSIPSAAGYEALKYDVN